MAGLLIGLGLAAFPLRPFLSERTTQPAAPIAETAAPVGAAATGEPEAPTVEPPVAVAAPLSVAEATPAAANPVVSVDTNSVMSLEDVVARAVPAITAIHAGQGRGTGFFVRPDSVLTSAHVIDGHATVQLQVGAARYTARVVTVSRAADLAMLRVLDPSPTQPVLPLGSTSAVRVGQEVIAIGSALGVLPNTVTRGIVSATRRAGDITLLQTDAAINPGNSGGPLIDRQGRVIGVNTMKASTGAESIGFAVAIDHADLVVNRPLKDGAARPLQGLSSVVRGSAPRAADQVRQRGEREYASTMANVARQADQIDAYWNRYASTCVASVSRRGSREWTVALEPGGVELAASLSGCGEWLDAVVTNATSINTEVRRANERARRAGVFPGVMRDVRREQRLDYPGWNR